MQQAKDYNALLSNQQLDKERLAKLTLRLEQNQQHSTPATLKIVSAGKVDIINTADITFCQAAGDYSEINLFKLMLMSLSNCTYSCSNFS